MAVNDYQISYRGLTIGDGTNFDLIQVQGIGSLSTRTGDRANPRTAGAISGAHFADGHTVRIALEVRGTPGSAGHATDIESILEAFSPDQYMLPDETDDMLRYEWPGESEKLIFCRPVGRNVRRENATEFGLFPIDIELYQYDPTRYDESETLSGSQSGTFNITNDGNAYAWPKLTFDPNVSGDAKLTNNTNGDVIEFDNAGASAGLIFDSLRWKHGRGDLLIAYRSTTNYYGNLVSPRGPFRLDPGINSLTLNTGDNVQVDFRDAYG